MLTATYCWVGPHLGDMAVASVGDEGRSTLEVTIEDVEEYAALVGDHNPIHTDEEYAEATMFDGRIAHGLLAGGVVSAALAELPGDVVYVSQDFEFLAPVRPGDEVVATATVVEDLGEDRLRVRTETARGDTTVLTGEAIVLSIPHERPAEGTDGANGTGEDTEAANGRATTDD